MSQLTTIQQINVAKVSQYLCANEVSKGTLFGRRLAPSTPIVLYMERAAVSWMYNLAPSNDTLPLTGNYLYSLCKFNARALNIINSGSGGSVVPPSSGGYSYINLVDTITTQGSTYTNSYFVGALQIATMTVNSGPLQTILGGDFSVNTTTGVLTWSQTFFAGDIIALSFLRLL